jgi:hypothetical protein
MREKFSAKYPENRLLLTVAARYVSSTPEDQRAKALTKPALDSLERRCSQ